MDVTAATAAAVLGMMLLAQTPAAAAGGLWMAQTSGTEKTPAEKSGAEKKTPAEKATTDKATGRGEGQAVTVRGTVSAVDKENRTVTLKGPKGRTLTLDVKDPEKLDAIKAGDPVVATYMEAIAFQIKPAGTAAGTTTQESRVTSKPGETPAGAIGREVTVTAPITAIDKKANTVTIKGPEGNSATVKAKDPKNLERIKVGDMVEITYAQALAVSLDKQAKPAK
jgi:Cu/Ag efflux protein CusF